MNRRRRAIRLAEMMTQTYGEVCKRAEISKSTFDKWKNGTRNPSEAKLRSLARMAHEHGQLLMHEAACIIDGVEQERSRSSEQEELSLLREESSTDAGT